jgi:hypothetical protein
MREIQPISGPCVWHGREMANSPRWRRRIGDAQLAEIDLAVRQARARGLGWQTMTADDFPLPSFSALAEEIRGELEDGSGIVLLQGLDPSPYSLGELRLLYAAISRQIGTFVYSNRPARSCARSATWPATAGVRRCSATAHCRKVRGRSCLPTPAPSRTARCASTLTVATLSHCSASGRRRGAA